MGHFEAEIKAAKKKKNKEIGERKVVLSPRSSGQFSLMCTAITFQGLIYN